jgi:hypothetical protein
VAGEGVLGTGENIWDDVPGLTRLADDAVDTTTAAAATVVGWIATGALASEPAAATGETGSLTQLFIKITTLTT